MATAAILPVPASFTLPNGMSVFGLNVNDTLNVYNDIFGDDCYRKHGVTIRDGDCILDIGANTGMFILFLNHIGVDVRVFAFEPAPATFHVLTHNVEKYNRLPVELFNVGISRAPGKADFTYYPRFSNASTFYPDDSPDTAAVGRQYVIDQIPTLPWGLRHFCAALPRFVQVIVAEMFRRYYLKKEFVTCELWNLSDFIKEKEIRQIDLLKVDAEQSEEHILGGIADDDWPKIRQIVVEVHGGAKATQAICESLNQGGLRTTIDMNPAMPTLSLVYGVRG
ncbi:MAG: FkbM family methyltransferase [Planctomycetes bacterium]|nr:FkbM family methyltransferase [Planctomycetota bacterium]